jgi:hypothetical protein
MLFLDTGALLRLAWAGLSNGLGSATRLLIAAIAAAFLLALLWGMRHWTTRSAPPKRAAPRKRTQRPSTSSGTVDRGSIPQP